MVGDGEGEGREGKGECLAGVIADCPRVCASTKYEVPTGRLGWLGRGGEGKRERESERARGGEGETAGNWLGRAGGSEGRRGRTVEREGVCFGGRGGKGV